MAIKILHSTAMVMTISFLLLLLSTSDAWDNSPPECQYPCLPPPIPVTNCPPPPPSVPSPPVSAYPPPPPDWVPSPPMPGYPPPSPSSPYNYPPPFGFPAPPPPNPITPWFPWYYKTPPSASSAVAGDGGLGFLAFMLAISLGFLLQ